MMRKFAYLAMAFCLILCLAACGQPKAPPAPSQAVSTASEAPPAAYVKRYHGDYSDKDFSAIKISDSDGADVTKMVIDLWFVANEAYNPDDIALFERGDMVFLSENQPPYFELLNYDAVVDGAFTKNGRAQLEKAAAFEGAGTYIEKKDGKVYRMGPGGNEWNYGWMLADIQPKEASADRLVVTAKYAKYTGELNVDNDPNFVYEYAFVELTLVKEDGIWLVEDYIYPDIARYNN